MQKIDFEYIFRNFNGLEIVHSEIDGKKVPLTLKRASLDALSAEAPNSTPTKEDKISRYKLGCKIMDANLETDFTSEEIVLLKECFNKAYGALIYGKADELLK